MGDFNHLHVCWETGTADCKQSRRLLECVEDNLLVLVLDKPTREAMLLDPVLTSVDELLKEIETRGSLGCSDNALVKSLISRNMGLKKSRIRTNPDL